MDASIYIIIATVGIGALILIGVFLSRNDMTMRRYVVVNEAYWQIVADLEKAENPDQAARLATLRTKLEFEINKANKEFDRQKLPNHKTSTA